MQIQRIPAFKGDCRHIYINKCMNQVFLNQVLPKEHIEDVDGFISKTTPDDTSIRWGAVMDSDGKYIAANVSLSDKTVPKVIEVPDFNPDTIKAALIIMPYNVRAHLDNGGEYVENSAKGC